MRYYGQWMRDEAEKRIGQLYPKVKITKETAKERPDLAEYVGQELADAAGDILESMHTIAKLLEKIPDRRLAGSTKQRDARASLNKMTNPLLSADPPYSDNIGYAHFSDYFYVR